AQGQGDQPRGAADRSDGELGARAARRAQGQAGRGPAAASGPEEVSGGRRARGARDRDARRKVAGADRASGAARGRLSRALVGGARGTFSFLVADAKTRAMPLPIPATALAQKSEYQPGEHAELLVGGGAASGTYHLELWRGSTLLEHRVDRGATVRVWSVPVDA